jgi:hypothetical protein
MDRGIGEPFCVDNPNCGVCYPKPRPAKKIYLIGSLRNPAIPLIANQIREAGFDVFDDWFAAGPEADDWWQKYEKQKGNDYPAALAGYAATHVFDFDYHHLVRADIGVLVTPAGKSGHLELGYLLGQGKPGYIVIPTEPERWDVMYKFATGVYFGVDTLLEKLRGRV